MPASSCNTQKTAPLCTIAVGVAAVLLVGRIQGANAGQTYTYRENVVYQGDEMGYTTVGDTGFGLLYYTWGTAPCSMQGKKFAPPRSEAARLAYKASFPGGSIANGFVGIKYNASGDAPKYYVANGRFKDCLYAGYPFGDMSSWWADGVITQAEGDVTYRGGVLTRVDSMTAESNSHCVSYMCNNNDDCFGNGLSVSGNWSKCNCGGCAAGTSGVNCNAFTIGSQSYTIHPSLTYGTVASMRSVCEASGKSLFSTTTNKAEWDQLQTYIPSTFRFFVDLTAAETQSTWKNSKGGVVSTGATFASGRYGEWSTGEGTKTNGGRCVDMVGGKLYQSNCKGNRYFLCTVAEKPTTTTTTTNSKATANSRKTDSEAGGSSSTTSIWGVLVASVLMVATATLF